MCAHAVQNAQMVHPVVAQVAQQDNTFKTQQFVIHLFLRLF